MSEFIEWVVRMIQLGVAIVTMLVWIPVGFFFYIPLLGRSTAVFAGMVLYSALTRTDPKLIQDQLEHAVRFYPCGFSIILDTVRTPTAPSSGSANSNLTVAGVARFIFEIAWASLFWLGVGYALESLHFWPPILHQWVDRLVKGFH